MLRWLKALPLTSAIAALIVFATFAASCGSTNSQARFVNAISDDTQSLDIDFNTTKAFGGVGPFAASGSTYVSIPTGSDKIQGFASGTTTNPVFGVTSPTSFNSGSQYTVVATGKLTATVSIVAPVESSKAPANGTVNFNVINASPAYTQAVDVYILQDQTSTPGSTCFGNQGCTETIISDIASPASSIKPYTTTPANVPYNSLGFGYTIYVTPTGSPNVLPGWSGGYSFSVGSVSVGSIRTIVLVDNACTDPCNGGTMSSTPIVLQDLN
jgi:Domain of unknown function (DUF4397)